MFDSTNFLSGERDRRNFLKTVGVGALGLAETHAQSAEPTGTDLAGNPPATATSSAKERRAARAFTKTGAKQASGAVATVGYGL